MRQVEKEMIVAVFQPLDRARPSVRCGNNTTVTRDARKRAVVALHGNVIARYDPVSGDIAVTLAGWHTVTTRSRLNALLRAWCRRHAPERRIRVFQRDYVQYMEYDGAVEDWVGYDYYEFSPD